MATFDRSNNPMRADSGATAGSVSVGITVTGSVFFSAPTEVLEILWTNISATASLHLRDMDNNVIFDGVAEGNTRIIEDPRVFANGLRIGSVSTVLADSTSSVAMEDGTLFVWVR